mgnify:CR=1 FL=1
MANKILLPHKQKLLRYNLNNAKVNLYSTLLSMDNKLMTTREIELMYTLSIYYSTILHF